MKSYSKDEQIKILLYGPPKSGKTQLIQTLLHSPSEINYKPTSGVLYYYKNIQIQKDNNSEMKNIQLTIADTSGNKDYLSKIKLAFPYQNIILMLFDLSSKESYDFIVQEWNNLQKEQYSFTQLFFVGTRQDEQSKKIKGISKKMKIIEVLLNNKNSVEDLFQIILVENNNEQNKLIRRRGSKQNDVSFNTSCVLI